MVSPIFPISMSTFIDVAKPTIKAPGAATDTAFNTVSLMVVASILDTIPHTKPIIKNTAESSLRYHFKFKTPYKMTNQPIIKMEITSQLFPDTLYSLIGFDRDILLISKPLPKLFSGCFVIFLKYLTL